MKSIGAAVLLVCLVICGFFIAGCARARTHVDLTLKNNSAATLENAELVSTNSICSWGAVVAGGSATYMVFAEPVSSVAELHCVCAGVSRTERLDLSRVYQPGQTGELTFTVYDDRVEVSFAERK